MKSIELLRFENVSEGAVYYDSMDINKIDLKYLRLADCFDETYTQILPYQHRN